MIRLWHSQEVDGRSVSTAFATFAVSASPHPLPVRLENLQLDGASWEAVIVARPDVVKVGEAVSRLRAARGDGIEVVACCEGLTAADRDLLRRHGATRVVSPRDWSPASVAERLIAELLLGAKAEAIGLGGLVGGAPAMKALYAAIERLAPLNEPVLILGETGTGKELVATELHRRSGRRGSLESLNCAALSPELLESELFGHERGAFTGASDKRKGLLVHAGTGTFFLDEVGDLSPTAQAKLLRVIEERRVRPVGGNDSVPIQARLVFATHRDLHAASDGGAFRQDLFERLRGFTLELPPLRERREDLPLLALHFLRRWDEEYRDSHSIPEEAMDPLFLHDWPGNVRELRGVVRQLASEARSELSALRMWEVVQKRRSRSSDAPGSGGFRIDPSRETWQVTHDRLRAAYFKSLLAHTGGRRDEAIRLAGLSKSRFFEVLKDLKLVDEG